MLAPRWYSRPASPSLIVVDAACASRPLVAVVGCRCRTAGRRCAVPARPTVQSSWHSRPPRSPCSSVVARRRNGCRRGRQCWRRRRRRVPPRHCHRRRRTVDRSAAVAAEPDSRPRRCHLHRRRALRRLRPACCRRQRRVTPNQPRIHRDAAYARIECDDAVLAETASISRSGCRRHRSRGVVGPALIRPASSVGDYELTAHVVADGFELAPGETWRKTMLVTAAEPYPYVVFRLVAPTASDARASPRDQRPVFRRQPDDGARHPCVRVVGTVAELTSAPPPPAAGCRRITRRTCRRRGAGPHRAHPAWRRTGPVDVVVRVAARRLRRRRQKLDRRRSRRVRPHGDRHDRGT